MRIRTTASALAIASLLTGVVASGVDSSAAAVGAGKAGGCAPTWKVVATPPADELKLASVDAFSTRDAWFTGTRLFGGDRTAWHWDGKAITETAPIPTGPFFFQPGSHDIPTAGSFSSDAEGWMLMGDEQTTLSIADRWHDGRWTRNSLAVSPDPRGLRFHVFKVATVSSTDAWAFGSISSPSDPLSTLGILIEHWDGVHWSVVPHPASGTQHAVPEQFTVISANDVWLISRTIGVDGVLEPLVEHWDGTRWSIIQTDPASTPAVVSSVSASGPDDVWIAGRQTMAGTEQTAVPLLEHWDGTAWTVVENLPDLGNAALDSVFASGPSDVWATVLEPGQGIASFLHWDGNAWTSVAIPAPVEYGLRRSDSTVGGTGPTDVWALWTVSDSSEGDDYGQIVHLSCGKD